ncbi:acyltransferase family protein [Streptomyces sp. DSM 44917]|uniref:Acyltransferase family protein n=1 Tax=Streptomyces boetiae TaxID=3075541 RepID=A0ABU2L7Z6_9ACTN|nr:acyltransferase family protein [Streptomyces sp. DSM 44917]MDT0307617.1 acyltransferase family protein [Streptomyces sp. DSM 44917]
MTHSTVPRQAAPSPAREKTAPPARDALLDNAKFLAIVLVAAGHAWEPLRSHSHAVTALYLAVYAFHMPAFIVISGYLSRGFDGSPGRVRRLITGVLVPYVVFQVAYTLVLRRMEGNDDAYIPLFEPRWLLWFLLALLLWRLSVPLWKAVRHPVPLALAVAAVASASPSLGSDFQLQRVLQFLPFFVLGLTLRPEHLEWVRRRAVRLAAVPVFAVAGLVAYWAAPRMNHVWFYHREAAQDLGAPWWAGVGMTLALFACSAVLTACFLALVPRRRTWFTVLGAGTLYGYLLHGFLIRGSREWGWYEPDLMHEEPAALLITTAVAVAGITLLCTPVVARVFRPVVEPRLNWLFRPPSAARGAAQGRNAPVPAAPARAGGTAPAPRG